MSLSSVIRLVPKTELRCTLFLLSIDPMPPRSTRPDTPCPAPTLFRSRPRTASAPMATPRARWRRSRPGGSSTTCCYCRRSRARPDTPTARSEEHTSELQSLMRISYAVFCLKKQNKHSHCIKILQTQHTHIQEAPYHCNTTTTTPT